MYKGFLILMAICAALTIVYVALPDSKTLAKGNRCPYEYGECPNQQANHYKDSCAYADAEYIIDSLYDRTQALETQLAGCELKDHSRLVAH